MYFYIFFIYHTLFTISLNRKKRYLAVLTVVEEQQEEVFTFSSPSPCLLSRWSSWPKTGRRAGETRRSCWSSTAWTSTETEEDSSSTHCSLTWLLWTETFSAPGSSFITSRYDGTHGWTDVFCQCVKVLEVQFLRIMIILYDLTNSYRSIMLILSWYNAALCLHFLFLLFLGAFSLIT